MIPFKGKRPAEGVEFVLYKCPKCKSEFTMHSENNRLICTKCNNAVIMNKYLLFEPADSDTVFFDGIDRWFDYQRECLMCEIEDPEFQMTAMTELRYNEPGCYGYQLQGRGQLRITRESIKYTGTVKDETAELIYPMKNIPMVPYAAGEYLEVAVGDHISRFIFDDKPRMMKWVLAVRLIRDQYYEEIKHYEEKK
jgi:DNA-directed RNA polymerase subunit RPC12/RpoP